MSVSERKSALRREIRTLAGGRGWAAYCLRAGDRAREHFLRAFPPRPGMSVALYSSLSGEIPTVGIREAYLSAGVRLYYPRVAGKGSLAFYPHRVGDPWETGPYGIPEPPIPPGVVPRAEGFDIIVVPGLAFDPFGRRLGHGFGYYDRFLASLSGGAVLVGLACRRQLVPEVPVDAWDVSVHAVVTEEGVIRAAEAAGVPRP